jgi:TRAP-type mannitol/chloroaromatic compound transport system permease large subunit
VPDKDVQLSEIFWGSTPFWIVLLMAVIAISIWPGLATFLPNL